MNAAEIVTVRKNSAELTVPTTLRGSAPWISRFEVTTGPPAAAAGRVEEAADEPQRRRPASLP
jgi:hypothetical protein